MKNTLLFIYSTNILVRLLTVNMKNCLTPKNPKMCDPILVTLLKMRPHYSQSSRENATPSSGTSPLASYKEVRTPPPELQQWNRTTEKTTNDTKVGWNCHVTVTEKSASKIPTATWLPPLLSEKTGFEIHTSGAYVSGLHCYSFTRLTQTLYIGMEFRTSLIEQVYNMRSP